MATDDVGRVGAAEDFHFSEDLAAESRVGVIVDEFERINSVGAFMTDFVNCATIAWPRTWSFSKSEEEIEAADVAMEVLVLVVVGGRGKGKRGRWSDLFLIQSI